MVALADIVQVAERLKKVVDAALPSLEASLLPLGDAGREALPRTIANASSTAQAAAPTTMAVSSDIGLDLVVAKVDPAVRIDPETFTIDGTNDHPWIKEDLSHISHATTEKERHDREHGRGSRHAFINAVPRQDLVPWANPEPPRMRDGAQIQNRHPRMRV